jgi:N-acetylneuraminic acid mutarotase
LSFTTQAVGATSPSQTVTITNSGAGPISISGVAITGASASSFAQTNTCGSPLLAGGGSCNVSVTFTPTASGPLSAQLTFSANASSPAVALTGTGGVPTLQLSTASLSFGNAPVGSSDVSQPVALLNSGPGSLSVSSISLAGPAANAFKFDQGGCDLDPLTGSDGCVVTVTFAPTQIGLSSASLQIGSTASAAPSTVSLSGTASQVSWAWMGGPTTAGAHGTYGTLGTPSAQNSPGARDRSVSWADAAGNLWLFGGHGQDGTSGPNGGELNDLWKYDRATGQWTWMSGANVIDAAGVYGTKGVGSTANTPGCRDSAISWTDHQGNFWLFGGWCQIDPRGNSPLNDLWKYDPSSGEWTWVNGANTAGAPGVYGTQGVPDPGNVPGARYGAVSWIDAADNLWLFGGSGLASLNDGGSLNDLWKYEPSSGLWTWVSGPSTADAADVYGTQGVASAANMPGARYHATAWFANGSLWLFSGSHIASSRNDLWKYDIALGQWTWMSGTTTPTSGAIYGTDSAVPGARINGVAWTDASGNLLLFGGMSGGPLNDLWKYDTTSNEWSWIGGSSGGNAPSVYGTQGVFSPANDPGARAAGISWVSGGQFWMFGGGNRSDLWVAAP